MTEVPERREERLKPVAVLISVEKADQQQGERTLLIVICGFRSICRRYKGCKAERLYRMTCETIVDTLLTKIRRGHLNHRSSTESQHEATNILAVDTKLTDSIRRGRFVQPAGVNILQFFFQEFFGVSLCS